MKYKELYLFCHIDGAYTFGTTKHLNDHSYSDTFALGPIPESERDEENYAETFGGIAYARIVRAMEVDDMNLLKKSAETLRYLFAFRRDTEELCDEEIRLREERDAVRERVQALQEEKEALVRDQLTLLLAKAKPCRYVECAGNHSNIKLISVDEGEFFRCWVGCTSCDMRGPTALTGEEAIDMWNNIDAGWEK